MEGNRSGALHEQGLEPALAWHNEHTHSYRYLLSKKAWHGADKIEYSLFLEFTVDDRFRDDATGAKPGNVLLAQAGLVAEPNRPYAEVLKNGEYPKDTVVDQGLRLLEVETTVGKYPVVKEIEVYYDHIGDMWTPEDAQGFHLTLSFGDSPDADRHGKKLYFTSTSGLDPLEDWHGHPLPQPFRSRDTLGEFRGWGSEEWGLKDP